MSDGGVVVEDCLVLLLNLLKDNKSNQTLFVEGNYVRRLTQFFDIEALTPSNDLGWSAQKVKPFWALYYNYCILRLQFTNLFSLWLFRIDCSI